MPRSRRSSRSADRTAPSSEALLLTNAQENNLKGLSLAIPHDQLTVVTGLSGSGKSSLAFDTVYAEGQRRYIETFSPYTRQFFDKVKKPRLELAERVRPAVAIQQRTRILSSRSTVGTLTNINDYLKVLWSNIAVAHCNRCGSELRSWNAEKLTEHLVEALGKSTGGIFLIGAPVEVSAKSLRDELDRLSTLGFSRLFDTRSKEPRRIDECPGREIIEDGRIVVLLDRISSERLDRKRLRDSSEQAFTIGRGRALAIEPARGLITEFRTSLSCPQHDVAVDRARPSLFSYNHPFGACPECRGFGRILEISPELCVPDPDKSILDKALQCWAGDSTRALHRRLLRFCETQKIPTAAPWRTLTAAQQDRLFTHRSRDFVGVMHWFKRLERKAYKMHVRVFLSRYRQQVLCPSCSGGRLKQSALAYRVDGRTLPDLWNLPALELQQWLGEKYKEAANAGSLTRDVRHLYDAVLGKLRLMIELGLPYLTLDRQARTLSGGETQRVNLATALGSDLISTQFVLDEPSVGLHARDTSRLIAALQNLRDQQNSVLVVEHDLECIAAADHIVELGPRAGEQGGRLVYHGPRVDWPGIRRDPLEHLSQARAAVDSIEAETPSGSGARLVIRGATVRNISNLDLELPLQRFVALTGVSGSGKSSLIHEVLETGYRRYINHRDHEPCCVAQIEGFEQIDQFLLVDQSPLSKTPRANIATYTKIWDYFRNALAHTPEATAGALAKSAFSFNVDGGRCPACNGAGFITEDMQFLSDVYIPCEVCLGRRFQDAVLAVRLRNRNVDELLGSSVEEIGAIFSDCDTVAETCALLGELGLGHLTLGHPLSELSGGEAQRLKLIPFLQSSRSGKAFLIFDEPTTGLHYDDVRRLITLLERLGKHGHSILCVEHNLELIARSDWIVDLGPEGGAAGGEIVFQGTPLAALRHAERTDCRSHTVRALKEYVQSARKPSRSIRSRTTPLRPSDSDLEKRSHLAIIGAREHNLKNIDLMVPLYSLVAFTGVSGSGKSTLAKDIIYAEGQRRYLDCLSPYARQFIKELKRPQIESIRNAQPTVCVYQHTFQPSRLSTVATMSEIYNFLRLLYAKAATQYCPAHPEQAIAALSPEAMSERIAAIPARSVRVLAPIIKSKKGHHNEVLRRAIDSEMSEVRADGVIAAPAKFIDKLERRKVHSIDYVVGRFNPAGMGPELIREAVMQGLALGGGTIIVIGEGEEIVLSSQRACPICQRGFFRADPEDLSFNSRRGACRQCEGRGTDDYGERCRACAGSRLNEVGRNLRLDGRAIHELCALDASGLRAALNGLSLDDRQRTLAASILPELSAKIDSLVALGLDYLALDRECCSLSGGELQRLRLATAIGSPLSGVMYIFDEPSAGLHPLDTAHVVDRLRDLNTRGNSVIVIEHDLDTVLQCDHIVDVGPGGGRDGGEVTFNGRLGDFLKDGRGATAESIAEHFSAKALPSQPAASETQLTIRNGSCHNIRNISLELPLNRLIGVAGVSGAGKSSLVHGILLHTIQDGGDSTTKWRLNDCSITSDVALERVLFVDQKPIGANSRSTPASYLGLWDQIRKIYAGTVEAKSRGWGPGHFSYNTGKGRCKECKGQGQIKLEMNFLPDAFVECDACDGRRYTDDTNSILYLGRSISDVLAFTFAEAKEHFSNHGAIHRMLHTGCAMGLGYLTLGQSSATLSGGESQRLKLIAELSAAQRGHALYVLDEPTTGLHRHDVNRLICILRDLVDKGNTVVVIEHDEAIIRNVDHLIELGPGPGADGGRIIFQGSPRDLAGRETPWGTLLQQSLQGRAYSDAAVSAIAAFR